MKKYLLLLILILLITFTLTGYSADLFTTYDQRIKLTVDHTKIDSDLTWFPVTVLLTDSQAEEVFSELDADSDYMKCAFTKADGETELYAECELFDHSESLGIYHVSRDGWVIAHDADTDFYMYYDNDHADNTDYVSATNSITDLQEEISTATYDAFGLLIKTGSDTIIYFFREGASHAGDKGKIVKQVYTISTKSWGERSTVYDDANENYDSRNVGGGIIGSNIYLFFGRADIDPVAWVDIGYIKSTDLTGSSWGDYTAINTGAPTFSPYGHIVSTATSGKYLQPVYMIDDGTYSVKFFETTDNGDNWTIGDTIYSGAAKYTETCVAYIGDSEMIALLRNGDGAYVAQSVSDDNGETWSAPVNTNLGTSNGTKVPWIYYDSTTNKVIVFYADRSPASPKTMRISNADADTVHASATSWGTTETIYSSALDMAYPSINKVADNKFHFVFAIEKSVSDVDTWGGYYSIAGRQVWDDYFTMVQHMADATTSTIKDSTSNVNHGAKIAANQPVEAAGKVGQGQDFDGNNDYISVPDSADFDFAAGFTLEAIADPEGTDIDARLITRYDAGSGDGYFLYPYTTDSGLWIFQVYVSAASKYITSNAAPSGAFQHIVGVRAANGVMNIYIDGVVQTDTDTNAGAIDSNSKLWIGCQFDTTVPFPGIMDEVRISDVARSAGWIKATYNSLWDTLLTYGSEETEEEEEDNAVFFGTNF